MAIRILLTKPFARQCKRAGLAAAILRDAAAAIERGEVEARLGGYLVKKRIARPGGGKRGGFRTIVAHRQGNRLVYLYLFAKAEKANITEAEQVALQTLGANIMACTERRIDALVRDSVLQEIAA